MWLLWFICALLLVIAMALLIRPLFRTCSDSELAESQLQADQRKELNIKLYEEKKVQIEQDFANGLLDEESREQAQHEIEHSLLNDAATSGSTELVQLSNDSAKKLALVMLAFVPVLAIIVYINIMPKNVEQIVMAGPAANRAAPGTQQPPVDVNAMVVSLENKLKENPENIQGWNMLGRSYLVLKRYEAAVIAYEKAIELAKKDETQNVIELQINYVEALMQTGKRSNFQQAQNLLAAILEKEPENGDALWFMGFIEYEMGSKEQASKRWTYLLSILPPGDEQANVVKTYLTYVNNEINGIPNAQPGAAEATAQATAQTQAPQPGANAAPAGPAAGQQLTGTKEEQAFIASMVARVEKRVKANPQDLKSWQTLGKSYAVLNRLVDSAEAYGKAVALDSSDPDLLMAYSDAVIASGDVNQMDKARIVFAQLVDKNPQHLDALFLAGTLARIAGDAEEAKMFWGLLLPQLTPGGAAYKNVENNINSL